MCIFKPGLRKFRSRPSESTLSTKASLLFHLDLIKTPLLVPNYKKLDLFQPPTATFYGFANSSQAVVDLTYLISEQLVKKASVKHITLGDLYQDGFTVSIAEDQVTHTSADIIIYYFIPIYHNRKLLAVASFMPTLLTLNQITKNKDLLIQSKIPTIAP